LSVSAWYENRAATRIDVADPKPASGRIDLRILIGKRYGVIFPRAHT